MNLKSSLDLQKLGAVNQVQQGLLANALTHTQTFEGLKAQLDAATATAKTTPSPANQQAVDQLKPQVQAAQLAAESFQTALKQVSQTAVSELLRSMMNLNTWVWGVLIFGLGYILYHSVGGDKAVSLLETLKDQASARGMITVLVLGTSMSLAIMLVYQAYQVGTTNENFRMAREIFGSLIGIVGTIIGFYFGSMSDKPKETPASGEAEQQVKPKPDGTVNGAANAAPPK